jgi:hypothetical protein
LISAHQNNLKILKNIYFKQKIIKIFKFFLKIFLKHKNKWDINQYNIKKIKFMRIVFMVDVDENIVYFQAKFSNRVSNLLLNCSYLSSNTEIVVDMLIFVFK